ncbi:MAG: hypothetical protein LRS47_02690 [Desulfurococcales archaeon]|nr:hypothetical protein [Desulfurococcales archaeon]
MLSLIVFITAIIFSWIAVLTSKALVNEEAVRRALEIIEEYRRMLSESASRPRLRKKLRAMEAQYKKARKLVLFNSMKRMAVLVLAYSVSSVLVMVSVGTSIISPIYIPGITLNVNNAYYVPTVLVHFLGYIYALLLFRRELII